jgi:hypothetical protein
MLPYIHYADYEVERLAKKGTLAEVQDVLQGQRPLAHIKQGVKKEPTR